MIEYQGYKITETPTHIFFLTGPYSNWHPTVFHGKIAPDGPVLRFTHGEQYIMAAKALLFGDPERLKAIMEAKRPHDQKMLGRAVCDFTKQQWDDYAAPIWDKEARDIMFRGCWYKQQFNEEYRLALTASKGKQIVEANKNDPIWAVGLSWDDPAILDPANWRGTNWLGEAHMEVRNYMDEENFDPWMKLSIG